MASFLDRLLGRREPSSAAMARERLKLVLVTDRSNLSPEALTQMQAEIIEVIKRYISIDETHVNISYEQRNRKNYLVADVALTRDQMYRLPDQDADEESGDEPSAG
jgi:cell division topological specificity factor